MDALWFCDLSVRLKEIWFSTPSCTSALFDNKPLQHNYAFQTSALLQSKGAPYMMPATLADITAQICTKKCATVFFHIHRFASLFCLNLDAKPLRLVAKRIRFGVETGCPFSQSNPSATKPETRTTPRNQFHFQPQERWIQCNACGLAEKHFFPLLRAATLPLRLA